MHDALCVLQRTVAETRTVQGGGCCEALMANAVHNLAVKTPGKESVAMESFARALMQVSGGFGILFPAKWSAAVAEASFETSSLRSTGQVKRDWLHLRTNPIDVCVYSGLLKKLYSCWHSELKCFDIRPLRFFVRRWFNHLVMFLLCLAAFHLWLFCFRTVDRKFSIGRLHACVGELDILKKLHWFVVFHISI